MIFSFSVSHTTQTKIASEMPSDLWLHTAPEFIVIGSTGDKLSEQDLSQVERRVFELINQQRAQEGKPPLVWDEKLAQAARAHSQNMAKRRFFSHRDPRLGGLDRRLRRFRIPWKTCGENIWLKQSTEPEHDDSIASEAVTDWMNSPGHRSNILAKVFTHTGVGAYYCSNDGGYYLTQIFNLPPKK